MRGLKFSEDWIEGIMSKEKDYIKRECLHCGNETTMEVVASYSMVSEHSDEKTGFTWNAGSVYQILICPACKRITLLDNYYHDHFMEEDDSEVLYPKKENQILGLSKVVAKAYSSALKVRTDANAYATLLGRVLDLICLEKKAKGDSLYKRILFLSKEGIIPETISAMANHLRSFRNIGAHADLGELSESEISILDDLCKAILEYVYHGPYLISPVQ